MNLPPVLKEGAPACPVVDREEERGARLESNEQSDPQNGFITVLMPAIFFSNLKIISPQQSK